jgi:hypothetical protein
LLFFFFLRARSISSKFIPPPLVFALAFPPAKPDMDEREPPLGLALEAAAAAGLTRNENLLAVAAPAAAGLLPGLASPGLLLLLLLLLRLLLLLLIPPLCCFAVAAASVAASVMSLLFVPMRLHPRYTATFLAVFASSRAGTPLLPMLPLLLLLLLLLPPSIA